MKDLFYFIRGNVRYYAKKAFLHFVERKFGVVYSECIQEGLNKRIAYYESHK